MVSKPRPLVLCGPSGSGKSTLMKLLMAEFGEYFGFSVSHTTRQPRPGEKDGKDYHYVDRDIMQQLMDNNEFIENATFSGNMYGTSKTAVQDVLDSGKICILDIDCQGVRAVKQTDLDARYVFMKPPSLEVLEARLRARGTETEESLAKRLGAAAAEMAYGEVEGNFEIIIVNDQLEAAYQRLRSFVLPDVRRLMPDRPRPLVLCGPSGSGKSTIMKKLTAEYGEYFGFSVSHTTRQPRPGEQDGVDYHYVTREKMQELIEANEFIENAEFSGNMYGTSENAVHDVLDRGKICILDIDVQGVKAVKGTDLDPLYVFIKPPSVEALEERLVARGTETKASLLRRLGAARQEMEYGEEPGNFDIVIVNDDLEMAYLQLRSFVIPEINKLRPVCAALLRPLVICGPSGAGKSTIIKKLMAEFKGYFGFCISHTTRHPRLMEEDGLDYHFTCVEAMEKLDRAGEFIEHTVFSGNMYGTSKAAVQDVLDEGKICILDIDVNGVRAVKETDLKPRYIFITPPSLDVLEGRLRSRGTETKASLLRRLAAASWEVEYGLADGNFDIVIINDNLEKAYYELKEFMLADIKKSRPPGPCPLVLCGPSGSGKSTVMKLLISEYGQYFGFSVSHTTRKPRPGEQDGVDYHYVTREKMQELIERKEFIENASFSGNMYGTSKTAVQDVLDSGKICILDIDTQGVKAVKKTALKPRYVFIKPPSLKTLERRLRDRGTETEDSLMKRLGAAEAEMKYGEAEGNFDIVIVNDNLETAYLELRNFIMPEIERLTRCTCGTPASCCCIMADIMDISSILINDEDLYIKDNESIAEAEALKSSFSTSVTVRVANFLDKPMMAVRMTSKAGEIEVPQGFIESLERGAVLCSRVAKPAHRSGCSGTAIYRVGNTDDCIHIMWSSPNNFDRHASHLSVGVSTEKTDKFDDMYYQRPSWFARKYVYHDRDGIWFNNPDYVIHARSTTRPTSDVFVYVFPSDPNCLPEKPLEFVKSLE